ncbi:hypothetical protein LTR36_010973 [Oleoguttula mirabilis]|uniref:Metallo-beta-lactamase domain-containing protein n=1 Tax=Oleoguttula mirabilis TaxID=1507867 RepID=A0AAV9J4B4_9PEZI|nr:hypothetical protein LTR36_010973 [Oleoguttula mirabilis]
MRTPPATTTTTTTTTSTTTTRASTSFTTRRINPTTFLIREDDAYGEHPFIYVKVHPRAPVIVVCDTGCDEPSEAHKYDPTSTREHSHGEFKASPKLTSLLLQDRYIHLRHYLEHYALSANNNEPLNPGGKRKYIIICTHCHFDHTGGLMHFLAGGTTEIVASAAGRDFIESDLGTHGIFDAIGRPPPYYRVTKWAQAFERLQYPFPHTQESTHGLSQQQKAGKKKKPSDLAITILQTIGHTPDELAWYDHEEMHLYVGDSFYREGEDGMPIIFPREGNLIEWIFAMQKLAVFVRTENAKAAAAAECADADGDAEGWVQVPRRVLVSCAHQTTSVDGAEILKELEVFSFRVMIKRVPVVDSRDRDGEVYDTWREAGEERTPMSIMAPRRLMEDVRDFFGHV